jgi:hypothetical protein
MTSRQTPFNDFPTPLSLSLSKASRGACAKFNPHRGCFDKLSMSGLGSMPKDLSL